MRGKGQFLIVGVCAVGITPAYAGKSTIFQIKTNVHWDHPRLCGEKFTISSSVCIPKGSPPPMRGKDEFHMKNDDELRITPAYAGKRGKVPEL